MLLQRSASNAEATGKSRWTRKARGEVQHTPREENDLKHEETCFSEQGITKLGFCAFWISGWGRKLFQFRASIKSELMNFNRENSIIWETLFSKINLWQQWAQLFEAGERLSCLLLSYQIKTLNNFSRQYGEEKYLKSKNRNSLKYSLCSRKQRYMYFNRHMKNYYITHVCMSACVNGYFVSDSLSWVSLARKHIYMAEWWLKTRGYTRTSVREKR